jgi:hypothetical protein
MYGNCLARIVKRKLKESSTAHLIEGYLAGTG